MTKSPEVDTKSSRLLKDFAGYTTIHGFHFVLGLYAPIRRLIWLCLILACVAFLVLQLVTSFQKLQANRHVLDTNVIPSNKLTFPAFTMCNVNMMKRSKLNGTDAQLYMDKLDPLKKNQVKNKTIESSFDIQKAVLEYGHSAKDMVKACLWQGKNCSAMNFTTSLSYQYGLCHTFNLGNNSEQLVSSTSNQKGQGLVLLIDIDNTEYYGLISYLSTGIKVVVHDQNEYPLVEDFGNDIMPGFATSIKIKREKFKRLPPPYRSACGSKQLVSSTIYSHNRCMMECHARYVIQKLGCRLLGMPNLPEFNYTGYCNPDDIYRHDSRHSLEFQPKPPPQNCDCPLPCEEIKYRTAQDLAYFPSQSFMETFTHESSQLLASQLLFRARFMIVEAHFEDLNTYITVERPSYDISDFGSDVGGNLGLFLGCSVLTLIEVIDFLIVYCSEKYKARIRSSHNLDSNVEAR